MTAFALAPRDTVAAWTWNLAGVSWGTPATGETWLVDPTGPGMAALQNYRDADELRPGDHGVLAIGPDLLGSTDLTWTVVTAADTEAQAMSRYGSLAQAFGPTTDDVELYIGTPLGQLVGWGRPRGCVPDWSMVWQGVVTVALRFTLTDPVFYSAAEHSLTLAISTGSQQIGRGYPYGYDRGYLRGAPAWLGSAVNAGNARAWPLVIITPVGSVSDPAITHTGLGRTVSLAGAIGSPMWLDFAARAVLAGGDTDRSDLLSSRGWFALAPGANPLKVSGSDGAASVEIRWRDGWLL